MITEAVGAGYYHSQGWGENYPKVQILSTSELLKGTRVKMPPQFGTFKQAPKVQGSDVEQRLLDLG